MSLIVTKSVVVAGPMPETAGVGNGLKSGGGSFEETMAQFRAQSSQTMAKLTNVHGTGPQTAAAVPPVPVAGPPTAATSTKREIPRTTGPERSGPVRQQLENLEAQWNKAGGAAMNANAQTDPAEFLKLQGEMYQLEERLAVFSKAVEQGTSGVKQILQMQI